MGERMSGGEDNCPESEIFPIDLENLEVINPLVLAPVKSSDSIKASL